MRKQIVKYPIKLVVLLLCDKWKFIILCKLRKGVKRFGELERDIGNISAKVLTSEFKELERNGFINRRVCTEVPLRVEYSLTELGESLYPIMKLMFDWGMANKERFIGSLDICIQEDLQFPQINNNNNNPY